ncbi:MAG: lysophospholipase [Nanoarchaeota archaeon]|nr:lysophospholipase [Nanoarchaeota archaeon]
MTHKQYFTNFKRHKISCHEWLPEKQQSIEATVIFLHGYGGYSKYLEPFAKLLNERNIAFYVFDQIGFGESSGHRGHIDTFETYLRFIQEFSKNRGSYYLIGQSIGSLIGLRYAIDMNDKNLKGVICGSPPLEFRKRSKSKELMAKVLGTIRPRIKRNISPPHQKSDSSYDQAKINDSLRVNVMSMGYAKQLFGTMNYLRQRLAEISVPVLFLQSSTDTTVNSDVVLSYANRIAQIELKEYETGGHNLFESDTKEKVTDDVVDWIKSKKREKPR